jgi:hypothetical protein
LPDSAQVFYEWRTLVVQYNIIGGSVHDACLVAGMKVHDITRILTFAAGAWRRNQPEAVNGAQIFTLVNIEDDRLDLGRTGSKLGWLSVRRFSHRPR